MKRDILIYYGERILKMEVEENKSSVKIRFVKENGKYLESFIYPHQKGYLEYKNICTVKQIDKRAKSFEELIFLLIKYAVDTDKYAPSSIIEKESKEFLNLLVYDNISGRIQN